MTDTWFLALDASTPRSVIALGCVDATGTPRLVAESVESEGSNQASASIVPRIEALLARAGIGAKDLAAVGCGRGPGTFTGTRVAVATAMGLALGIGRPVVPVSTLTALALSSEVNGRVLALLDARRKEVYAALYACSDLPGPRPSVELRAPERCATPAEVSQALGDVLTDVTLVGPGVTPYLQALPDVRPAASHPCPGPSARGLWLAMVAAIDREGFVDPARLDAVYLRQSYAELGINRPKRPVFESPLVRRPAVDGAPPEP